MLATNIACAIAAYIGPFVICRPRIWLWNSSVRCGDQRTFYLWYITQSLLLDVVVVVMPMPLLYRLQVSVFKRVSLMLIFGMGT
jgi:hypothetical protein